KPERPQCQVQLRRRAGARRQLQPAGERCRVSRVGVRTQRALQADVADGGAQLAAVSGDQRVRVLLVPAGSATSGWAPAECLRDGQLLLFLQRWLDSDERDRGSAGAAGWDNV